MQPNTPKQFRPEPVQRERPLQKSMFLPDLHSQPPPNLQQRNQPAQHIHYNPLKRSSMPVLQGIHQSNISPAYHYNNPNLSFTQSSFSSTSNIPLQYSNQPRAQSQHEVVYPNSYQNNVKNMNVVNRNEPIIEGDMRGFTKFQKQISLEIKANQPTPNAQNIDKDVLISQIVDQIKQKHLPNLLKSVKKQLYDDLHNLRVELQTLRDECRLQNSKQELFNNDIKSQTGNIINFNSNNINNINNISGKQKKQKQSQVCELQSTISLLESKFNLVEAKMSQNFTKFFFQFQKMNKKLQHEFKDKLKSGTIKSSMPPILLQYRQSFIIRKSPDLKSPLSQQITFTTNQYYIDTSGYLLDNQSRYLTDHKGNQIRLDQKHIRVLEQHRILHR